MECEFLFVDVKIEGSDRLHSNKRLHVLYLHIKAMSLDMQIPLRGHVSL